MVARIVHVAIGGEPLVDQSHEQPELVLVASVDPAQGVGARHHVGVGERLRRSRADALAHLRRRPRRRLARVHPFTAPDVMPATIWRWKKMYMISGGIVMSSTFANSRFIELTDWEM